MFFIYLLCYVKTKKTRISVNLNYFLSILEKKPDPTFLARFSFMRMRKLCQKLDFEYILYNLNPSLD